MESPWERWESFWVGGVRRGAVFRSFDGERLTSRIAFDDGVGAPFATQSLLSVKGETWDVLSFRQEPGGLRTHIRRTEAGLGVDTLPSSGECLLVSRLAGLGRERAGYLRVDEGQPQATPAPADIRRGPERSVDFPDGRIMRAERYDVVAGGQRVATHWAIDGAVVRSTWAGALTFSCGDETEALDGLDARLGEFLRRGFGD